MTSVLPLLFLAGVATASEAEPTTQDAIAQLQRELDRDLLVLVHGPGASATAGALQVALQGAPIDVVALIRPVAPATHLDELLLSSGQACGLLLSAPRDGDGVLEQRGQCDAAVLQAEQVELQQVEQAEREAAATARREARARTPRSTSMGLADRAGILPGAAPTSGMSAAVVGGGIVDGGVEAWLGGLAGGYTWDSGASVGAQLVSGPTWDSTLFGGSFDVRYAFQLSGEGDRGLFLAPWAGVLGVSADQDEGIVDAAAGFALHREWDHLVLSWSQALAVIGRTQREVARMEWPYLWGKHIGEGAPHSSSYVALLPLALELNAMVRLDSGHAFGLGVPLPGLRYSFHSDRLGVGVGLFPLGYGQLLTACSVTWQ